MGNVYFTITNIQRFSLHDGPGIRTTVFFKGCSLKCPWCSNPENISSQIEKYVRNGENGHYGQIIGEKELVKAILRDRAYYENSYDAWEIEKADQLGLLPGGVTFSGGECLLQMNKLIGVCDLLHKENIHIAVETCLFVPSANIECALNFIDLFYIDIKLLSKEGSAILGGDVNLYLSNFERVMNWKSNNGKRKPVIVRIPVIGGYTDSLVNRVNVKNLIAKFKESILKIEIIKEHNLGEGKYKSLGIESRYHGVDDFILEQYRLELLEIGIPIEICRI